MSIKTGELLKLKIEKLSLGGDGLGRFGGVVVFVPYSAPGDHLQVRVTEVKKNFVRADIDTIIAASPFRGKAECQYFGQCGGCNWQHLTYSSQLDWKRLLVAEALEKELARPIQVEPVVPSPQQYRYRNRIRLKKEGNKFGYFEKKSHTFIEVAGCAIAEDAAWADAVSEDYDDADFSFSQVNTAQNQNLVNTLVGWAQKYQPSAIYDLYAGSGNFTIPLAKNFRVSTVGVEVSPDSVQTIRKFIADQNFPPQKIEFYLSSVDNFLKRTALPENSLVVVDPARGGCSEDVLRSLSLHKICALFYISCNPATLARDLNIFESFLGRKLLIKNVQPFDMFPQTDHIETLVEVNIDR